ncbi:MAG: hypothetical protein E2590_04710 [Chryseobacterium sp.]|uniref:hypothetical protein n=1 Tax=Epilithonimonas caeni TaxID=365343 RepID=UPI000486EB8D|nr:hypothetical protein [Epilithonimonas caeni]MPS72435.1 hypothetical protein [Chryseobacterium sp.]
MNKIISTISILIVMVTMCSCRESDVDLPVENSNMSENSSVFQKTNDSILAPDSLNLANQPLPADPPPKNGHQW